MPGGVQGCRCSKGTCCSCLRGWRLSSANHSPICRHALTRMHRGRSSVAADTELRWERQPAICPFCADSAAPHQAIPGDVSQTGYPDTKLAFWVTEIDREMFRVLHGPHPPPMPGGPVLGEAAPFNPCQPSSLPIGMLGRGQARTRQRFTQFWRQHLQGCPKAQVHKHLWSWLSEGGFATDNSINMASWSRQVFPDSPGEQTDRVSACRRSRQGLCLSLAKRHTKS